MMVWPPVEVENDRRATSISGTPPICHAQVASAWLHLPIILIVAATKLLRTMRVLLGENVSHQFAPHEVKEEGEVKNGMGARTDNDAFGAVIVFEWPRSDCTTD